MTAAIVATLAALTAAAVLIGWRTAWRLDLDDLTDDEKWTILLTRTGPPDVDPFADTPIFAATVRDTGCHQAATFARAVEAGMGGGA